MTRANYTLGNSNNLAFILRMSKQGLRKAGWWTKSILLSKWLDQGGFKASQDDHRIMGVYHVGPCHTHSCEMRFECSHTTANRNLLQPENHLKGESGRRRFWSKHGHPFPWQMAALVNLPSKDVTADRDAELHQAGKVTAQSEEVSVFWQISFLTKHSPRGWRWNWEECSPFPFHFRRIKGQLTSWFGGKAVFLHNPIPAATIRSMTDTYFFLLSSVIYESKYTISKVRAALSELILF